VGQPSGFFFFWGSGIDNNLSIRYSQEVLNRAKGMIIMVVNHITVEKLERYSSARAEDMDLRHKDCAGPLDLATFKSEGLPYWQLKCSRCHASTVVKVGEDTKAIAMTAIDGKERTLAQGQTVEQVTRPRYSGGG
jgi:hypothetical protein